jgi:hypothetical protein
MALVLRSLIELRGWTEFISKGPAEAARFLHEANIDLQDIHWKLVKSYPDRVEPLEQEVSGSHIKFTRDVGDDIIFKICSKLIHPTSLLLTKPQETLLDTEQRQTLAILVAEKGWHLLVMLHDANWET